jgi:hypothetical protein
LCEDRPRRRWFCSYAQGPNRISVPTVSKDLSPSVASGVVRAICGCKRHEVTERYGMLHKLLPILILIYLLTGIELTPGGNSTVHIYTQTIHRTTLLTTFVGRLSGIRTQSGQTKINDVNTVTV